ncbi:unnamed protein product [Arctogadus glacialis]
MKKISEEWEERTEGSGSICPMGGTFDPIMYRNMEVIIRYYIDNRSGKTASAKRDREKLVLALYLEEGERCRTLQRVAGEIIANNNKAQPLPLKVEPPLHKLVSLYPLLKDNVESKGEVTLDEGDKQCNTQGRRGAPIHMDCYEGIRKAREECSNADISSSESKNGNEKEEKDDIEHVGEGSSQPYVKHITKNAKRKLKKRNERQRESSSGIQGAEEPGCSTSLPSPTPFELDKKQRRSRKGKKAPHTSSGSYPTLVDGQQALSPPVQQPQSQQSPTPPVTHVHIHNYGNPTNRNRQNQNEWPQGQFRNNQQHGSQGQRRGPLICFGCNQEGHIKKDCLINPFPSQHGQGNSYQGRQDQGSYNQGQQGPFIGQGY